MTNRRSEFISKPTVNSFEELEVEKPLQPFDYTESIRNGISFNNNPRSNCGSKNKTIPIIRLEKLYNKNIQRRFLFKSKKG
jgi:hypothetical protein